jgi:GNAT superfamily N-acetyltransferase
MIYPEFYDLNSWKQTIQLKCVNVLNDEIIGTLGCCEESDRIIYISSFYVHENYRYEGIGRILWNTFFEIVREVQDMDGPDEMPYAIELITAKDVYEPAYNFYVREGFKEVPIDFSSPYCTLVKMRFDFEDV